ncbi:MAG: hypothetical protein FWD77_04480 [Betaproteobacteria bacterium]|nr:hypothetical protein [Betaproteobacteria bacterium]
MSYALMTESGTLAGYTDFPDEIHGNLTPYPLPEGYDEADAPFLVVENGALKIDTEIKRMRARDTRIARIKVEASERIAALDWRLERARERDTLDLPGETLPEVLAAREAVRRASSRAEDEVWVLQDFSSITDYRWEVTDADLITVRQLSRVKFLRRFTPEEQATLLTAAQQNPALNAYLFALQNADSINLDDPTTAAGVWMLEACGLLPPGRAAEILGD